MYQYQDEFLKYLTERKNSSKNTLESYSGDVKAFSGFLSAHEICSLTESGPDAIQKYIDNLKSMGRSNSTIVRNIASIKAYFHFLLANDIIKIDPTDETKVERDAQKFPEILSQKEINRLLDQPDPSTGKGCRDKAMLELLYATGIRVSELISIDLDDVNLQVNILVCKSKNSQRIIPLHETAVKAISEYLKNVSSHTDVPSESALFVNMNGNRLTRQGFWKILKGCAASADITKEITPHTIRHTFATHLLENGAGLKDIKEMLGHTDISSTQIYSQLIQQKYVNSYKKFHPRAGK